MIEEKKEEEEETTEKKTEEEEEEENSVSKTIENIDKSIEQTISKFPA